MEAYLLSADFPIHSSRSALARRSPRWRCSRCSKKDLEGQSVAVVGLGVSGRAATRLALARGARVIAIDKNERWVPPEQDAVFVGNDNVRLILGHCDDTILEGADRVVVSPGVPLEQYGLSDMLHSGKQVMSELDFAAEVLPQDLKVLAVTGTNGKSTVTSFAGQILHYLGIKAFVGGNIGTPLSYAAMMFLESSKDIYQAAIVEVSSYQMEIPCHYFYSSVALVLNLTPDHLERHKTMKNYAETKCSVFSSMKHKKLAILPTGNIYLKEASKSHATDCSIAWIGDFPGVKIDAETKVARFHIPAIGVAGQLNLKSLKPLGFHNYCNAAVSAIGILGLDLGVSIDSISTIMDKLTILPHRLQFVCTDARGVTWVDDSKSTNVGSTYEGLMALKDHKLIVLLGGMAKLSNTRESIGFEVLIELLKHQKGIVTFGSSGLQIYKELCCHGLLIPCVLATNLVDAVKHAKKMARYGDTILLSPGCASFDEFNDYEHRGKIFQELATLKE